MSNSNRVFITGLGALTATGETAAQTWDALIAGQSGIAEIGQWDLSSWTHRLGGELKNFQPAKMLPDRKLMKVISRQDVMGINAAVQAVNHSQMLDYRGTLENPGNFDEQTGVYVGSPGNKYFQQEDFLPLMGKAGDDMQVFADNLFSEVHPMWLLRILPNNVLAYTGITYGFKGPNHNVTNHAVSGTQALLEAYHAIKQGQADRAVVVAYDLIEPQGLFYYEKIGVLSARHLRPFDKSHDGTILADGAAAIVLESEASARARSAVCYGEIAGGVSATEASGLFSIEAEGEHLASVLAQSLEGLQLKPSDIGMLIAHGNGNSKSDDSEAQAIKTVFGSHQVPVTAFKWSMGHTICASGILDTVLATYALRDQCIPGIANFASPALASEGLNISAQHRQLDKGKAVVMISRGFASINACLVIKACD
ncbi:3-oxoacyl-[acyl-carrier-protein] synthase 2 [Legionella massiliensis]|uniref:3-oxoacyl-[acyl-carrier-protein] synthase 2 n=1 Tax=Legionella massiliensis TaxID=1034943 RepID=A0A078L1Z9_9GAMM|nr:beta-ketoacyl synthase N-terminal-like domain-containing protein [Legionella massiliensis]CDZ78048.1 3-oxoacyl-[acyl-carrier-protein] synthase 2 [Legionella massiliensis]CEE13786.1 3-oxoacyl-[acyl-carrier-protein] synthase 2 [Legionella massiliensis]